MALRFVYTKTGEMAAAANAWQNRTHYYHYNPSGGKHYHADPECERVSRKFLPMERFLREQAAGGSFRGLTPCPYCVRS